MLRCFASNQIACYLYSRIEIMESMDLAVALGTRKSKMFLSVCCRSIVTPSDSFFLDEWSTIAVLPIGSISFCKVSSNNFLSISLELFDVIA